MGWISKILTTSNYPSIAKEELCMCSPKPSHLIQWSNIWSTSKDIHTFEGYWVSLWHYQVPANCGFAWWAMEAWAAPCICPTAHWSETNDMHSMISISEYIHFAYSALTYRRLLHYTALKWTKINSSLAIDFCNLSIILCLIFALAPNNLTPSSQTSQKKDDYMCKAFWNSPVSSEYLFF